MDQYIDSYGPSRALMKSYVPYGIKWFFVSTIERASSSMLGPGRYSETMVWEYDMENNVRLDLLGQDEDLRGSIMKHQEICRRLFETGKMFKEDDDDGSES